MTGGKRALVIGCGYVGLALVRALRARNAEVIGTSRSEARYPEIAAAGAIPATADVMDPSSLKPLAALAPDVVFDLVKPQAIGESRYTSWGTSNVTGAFGRLPLEALVYLSSTSVYGRREGEWTDEETPLNPSSPLGKARVEAEKIYMDCYRDLGARVRIARVPGIYGPGRTLRQRLETGA